MFRSRRWFGANELIPVENTASAFASGILFLAHHRKLLAIDTYYTSICSLHPLCVTSSSLTSPQPLHSLSVIMVQTSTIVAATVGTVATGLVGKELVLEE